jgi:hypothetical protein
VTNANGLKSCVDNYLLERAVGDDAVSSAAKLGRVISGKPGAIHIPSLERIVRSSLRALTVLCLTSTFVLAATRFAPISRAATLTSCGSSSASDSAYFLAFVRRVATDPAYSTARDFAGIPTSDSVAFWGNSAACDTVSTRFRAHLVAQTGDSLWDAVPVLLVRTFPNGFVADPKMTEEGGIHTLVTLDSSLSIVKVWKTR